MSEIVDLTIAQAAAKVARRELSSRELVDATLKKIAETEPMVHAYATVMAESARKSADRIDKDLARGVWLGPLAGIPIAFKDLVYTTEAPTEAGAKVLEGWIPPFDAAVSEELRSAGDGGSGQKHPHQFGSRGARPA